MNDTDQFEAQDLPPSKSQLKRDALALQALGAKLLDLPESDWAALGLPEALIAALREGKRIRAHGARRRQLQYIGKLMRDLDPEPIRAGLAALRADDRTAKRVFANAERWRDRLLREGTEAVAAFEADTGQAESGLTGLLADYAVATSDRAEKTLSFPFHPRVTDPSPLEIKGAIDRVKEQAANAE